MLHFDANHIKIGYLVTVNVKEIVNFKNNMKRKNLNTVFAKYLKNNISNIRLNPLDHVTCLTLLIYQTTNYQDSWRCVFYFFYFSLCSEIK